MENAPSNRFNVRVDERSAADALFTTLYAELHRLARRELNRRGPLGGFGVTTLLHEAYISISGTKERSSSITRGSWATPRGSCAG